MTGGTVLIKVLVPSVWPVLKDSVIYSGRQEETRMSIVATSDGAVSIVVADPGFSWMRKSAVLLLPDYPYLKIAFSWDMAEDISCYINGVSIGDESLPPVKIDSKAYVLTRFREPLRYEIPENCNIHEESFLCSVSDLQLRADGRRNYDRLESAAILRRLFLDSTSLVERVNRKYKRKLSFTVVTPDREKLYEAAGAEPLVHSMFIAPRFTDPGQIKHLTMAQYLGEPVITTDGQMFKIGEIIKMCANNKGAIHYDPRPKDSKIARLFNLGGEHRIFDIDICLACIPDIAWVAIHGLRPLVSDILANNGLRLS